MKLFTQKQLIALCQAVVELEHGGKRFLVDYGYDNAVRKAQELRVERQRERRIQYERVT